METRKRARVFPGVMDAEAPADMKGSGAIVDELERDGFVLAANLVSGEQIAYLTAAVERKRERDAYAIRDLLRVVPEVVTVARTSGMQEMVLELLGESAVLVCGIFFDKLPGANWRVAWHQDRTIAVRRRVDQPGYGPWSVKQGVPHVEPPVEVMESMLALRVHLDDCDEQNGAMRVVPGSHRLGRLEGDAVQQTVDASSQVICEAKRGDVLVMRPLLLHASSSAVRVDRRRVVHLEFARGELRNPLEWYEAHRLR